MLEKFGATSKMSLECVTNLLSRYENEDLSESPADQNLVKACFNVLRELLETGEKEDRLFKETPQAIFLPNQLWIMRPLHEMTFIGWYW